MPVAAGALARRAKAVRPAMDELKRAREAATRGGLVSVLPGDLRAADALRALLGLPAGDLPSGEGLLVHPAVGGAEVASHARALIEHERAGGRSLALLVGARAQRERMEREFLAQGLRMASIAHAPALGGPGAGIALDAVVRALGDEAPAAARRLPALRPTVSETLIAGAARRAGAVAAAPLAAVDLPVIALIQLRMATQLAAAHDVSLGPERALELAPPVAGGYGLRALARLAVTRLPAPALVRGAIAATATLAMGAALESWFRSGRAPESVDELRDAVERAAGRAAER